MMNLHCEIFPRLYSLYSSYGLVKKSIVAEVVVRGGERKVIMATLLNAAR